MIQTESSVVVAVKSFATLCHEADDPLSLDTYQRPYVWGTDTLDQLIADLAEYCENIRATEPVLHYYMGTVLLHQNSQKQKRYIIDGQQRITSLCLLHYTLTGALPPNQALTFRSSVSIENIKRAQAHLAQARLQNLATDLFKRIYF